MLRVPLVRLPFTLVLLATGCPDAGEVSPGDTSTGSSSGLTDTSATEDTTQASTPTSTSTAPTDDTLTSGPASTSSTDPSTTTGDAETTTGTDTHALTATRGDTDTTDSDDTTGANNSNSDSDTGDSTTGGTTTDAGDTTTTGTTGTTTTTGTTDTGDTSDTGDNGEEVMGSWCCEPGCGIPLMPTHFGNMHVQHSGARISTLDGGKNVILWTADQLEHLLEMNDVDAVALRGDTLVYRRDDLLHVVDAVTAVELASCPADVQWGVALDGSYVWTAGAAGLELLELDCSPRWSAPGSLGDAEVLAAADALHVYDADLGAQSVTHFDASDGAASVDAFLGEFASWFVDVPRYWTTQGQSHRVYDVDNTLVELATGVPEHGWGTRMAGNGHVWDIFVPGENASYNPNTAHFSGPAILSLEPDTELVTLIRLDTDPLTITAVEPACCVHEYAYWDFAFNDGAWVIGGTNGYASDHLARPLGATQALHLDGSQIGRVAVGLASSDVYLFDLAAGCKLTAFPPISRSPSSGAFHMPSDGSMLLSAEFWQGDNWMIGPRHGTRIYALPGGANLFEWQVGQTMQFVGEQAFSDDGSLWTRMTLNGMYLSSVNKTLGFGIGESNSNVLPKLAPDGQHFATSDGKYYDSWQPAMSYIYSVDPNKLVGVTDGVVQGFIDDEHLLIGHYKAPNTTFIHSTIVGLDGAVTQASTLPDIRRFARVATGEILAEVQPDDHAVIFDPFTGDAVWAAPPKAAAAIAGPDHIATSDAAGVQLVKWR